MSAHRSNSTNKHVNSSASSPAVSEVTAAYSSPQCPVCAFVARLVESRRRDPSQPTSSSALPSVLTAAALGLDGEEDAGGRWVPVRPGSCADRLLRLLSLPALPESCRDPSNPTLVDLAQQALPTQSSRDTLGLFLAASPCQKTLQAVSAASAMNSHGHHHNYHISVVDSRNCSSSSNIKVAAAGGGGGVSPPTSTSLIPSGAAANIFALQVDPVPFRLTALVNSLRSHSSTGCGTARTAQWTS